MKGQKNTVLILIVSLFFTGLVHYVYGVEAWQKLASPVRDDIHDVFFLDDRIGWAYTYGTGIIIRTVDGGRNWETVARLDTIYFEQIQFLDTHNGWICGKWWEIPLIPDCGF